MLLRRVGQQAEHGESDEKSIGLRARAQAKRGRHRVALRRRQPFATVQQSHAQLMQAGERKLHLPFRPDRAKDTTALGTLGGVLQQGRLADSGLAAQHQHRAPPQRALPPAADRASHTRSRGRPARPSRAEHWWVPYQTPAYGPPAAGLTAGDHRDDPGVLSTKDGTRRTAALPRVNVARVD